VVKLKLQYFGHVATGSAGQLAVTVLEGSMEGTCYQGKPRRQWLNDIEDWTGYKYIQLKEMSVDGEESNGGRRHGNGQLLSPTLGGGRPTRERYDLSNGAIFNDLERPLAPISRSRRYFTLNVSETIRDTDIFSVEY